MAASEDRSGRRDLSAPWLAAIAAFDAARARQGLRAATLLLDRQSLEYTARRFAELGLPSDPRQVRRAHLLKLIDFMMAEGLNASTVNKRIQAWVNFFGYLHAEGGIAALPTQAIRKLREDVPTTAHLDRKQLRGLVRQMKTAQSRAQVRTAAMGAVAIDAGPRSAELRRAPLGGLDLERQLLHLPAYACKGRRPRTLALGGLSVYWLGRWLPLRERMGATCDGLFISERSGAPANADSCLEILHKWARAAGIQIPVGWHTLRHTYAVNFLLARGHPQALQRTMGQIDPRTLAQYLQFTDQERVDMRSAMDRVLGLSDLIPLDDQGGGAEPADPGEGGRGRADEEPEAHAAP